MRTHSIRLCALAITAGLIATACQSSSTVVSEPSESSNPVPSVVQAEPVAPTLTPTPPRPEPPASQDPDVEVEIPDDVTQVIESVATGYRSAAGAWPGFEPNDYPVVLALKDDTDQLTGALAINHPAVAALGDAVSVDTQGTPFASLDFIANPTDRAALQSLRAFNLNIVLGGIDSFAMVAGSSDDFFKPTSTDFVSTLLHEMFHRHQGAAFTERGADQDIDGYDYSPANLELIGLEDRALTAAINAPTSAQRELAARHVVAIRNVRLAADPRVALDSRQEIREGTARYIEHLLAGGDTAYRYHGTNFDEYLIVDIADVNVKGNLAFGRWYVTGAAMLHLLDQLGADMIFSRVEAGEAPVDHLAALLGVESTDYEQLVADARVAYDPDSELAAQAEAAAEAVKTEPNFWGGGQDAAGAEVQQGEPVTLSQAEVDCLIERGVVFSAERLEISEEDWAACFEQG